MKITLASPLGGASNVGGLLCYTIHIYIYIYMYIITHSTLCLLRLQFVSSYRLPREGPMIMLGEIRGSEVLLM